MKAVYRWPWKRFTKFGLGLLLDDDLIGLNNVGSYERSIYCAVFANAILFIGKRQKWTIGADFGHGISSKKSEGQNTTSKGFSHTNSGFYYSASIGYRAIISKNILLNISPFLVHKNFRHRQVTEYFPPSSIQRLEWIEQREALGLAIGLVF